MISSRGGGGGDGDGSSNTANGRNNTNYNYNNTPTSKQEVGDKFQLLAGKIWPPFKSMEAAPSSAGARANKPRERERESRFWLLPPRELWTEYHYYLFNVRRIIQSLGRALKWEALELELAAQSAIVWGRRRGARGRMGQRRL